MDMERIYQLMKQHDTDLPRIAVQLLRRCDDCDCGRERGISNGVEFVEKLNNNAQELGTMLDDSINFCVNNPNVQLVARLNQLELNSVKNTTIAGLSGYLSSFKKSGSSIGVSKMGGSKMGSSKIDSSKINAEKSTV